MTVTLTSSWTRRAASHARARGLDASALLAELGIPADVLEDPHGRVLFERHAAFIHRVAERLDDPGVGFDLGAEATAADFGIVALLAESCATLRDALTTIRRYNALANEASWMDFWTEGDRAFVRDAHWRDGRPMPALIAEATMAYYLTMIHLTSDTPRPVSEVWFAHERHRGWTPAREARFGTTLRFAMPANGLVLPVAQLDVPFLSARPALSPHLARLAQHLEADLAAVDDPVTRVSAHLRHTLARDGPLPLHRTARALGTTSRTLQRELEARGRSYRELLEEVRRDVATTLLTESTLKLEAVAERAGYADARSFRRACLRWFGVTPGEYRRQHRDAKTT
ncbi:MAG: AraC family transcriptional regulator [Sandaracinaceae bacterium]|nr:AraC family transcriptional regulator [Sandaracinaceae bacterium]